MTQSKGRSYHYPTGVSPEHYLIPREGLGLEARRRALTAAQQYTNEYRASFVGYQSRAQLQNDLLLSFPFLQSAINNIGDSFANPVLTAPGGDPSLADGYFSLNFKWIERAVLDYFAERWKAGTPRRVEQDGPGDDWQKTYWGYVLSMGCTEGNLMAIRSARDYLKGRLLQYEPKSAAPSHLQYVGPDADPRFDPVLLMSEASHYSVAKLAQMLEIEMRLVPIDEHGRMTVDALAKVAEEVLKAGRPIAVIFNYGTTWTGALDDVEASVPVLLSLLKRYKMDWREIEHHGHKCWRHGYWFHVDGALGAGYATFTGGAIPGEPLPRFDFELGVQSIAMSGHKWPGAPWPTGIYMTQNRYMLTNDVPAYVGALDSTLAGSRSGLAPLYLWDWAARSSDARKKAEADGQLQLAEKARQLIAAEWDKTATRAPGSVMVVFKRPGTALVRKYALASMKHPQRGDLSHLVCMPHVTEEMIVQLVKDLTAGDALHGEESIVDDDRAGW
jgi:histidine decarboxylase